ncbi:tRNA lysidine(34) synthetase TilS [Sodalis sp. dw_96]|uniref:tRNA lysidine(34) synthetase TilS n=1 Tax=Sodalis sp. dw_96 TaxID=2719794 RepID=UPI001BD5F96C|nr:tRNA lysidine(34) synthetase TilS [Sodalis sp. dw_96]
MMLCEYLAETLGSRRRLLVAFSGGLDSTVLLDALVWLRQRRWPDLALRGVYIHHGLSLHADEWAAHCRAQCLRLDVGFQSIPVRVNPESAGLEAAAREARYLALQQALLPGETLVTAQHLDDQSETFLLALKRGSGPAGLSAMAVSTPFHGQELLRPLLDWSRGQLQDYARRRRLRWIEDDSNRDERFDRNFLRLQIMPLLTRRWPHFGQAVARSARLCADQEALLDELLQETLERLTLPDGSLDVAPMVAMSASRRGALLRRWLAGAGARMPAKDQLERLWVEVALSRPDAEPRFQLADRQVRRFRHRLYLLPLWRPLKDLILPWTKTSRPLALPDDLGCLQRTRTGVAVRAAGENEKVTVRFAAGGKLHIAGRRHGLKIKKLWQELGIAPWLRERTPLIFYNEVLIAAPGIFTTREGQTQDDQRVWYIEWLGGKNGNGQ